MRKELEGVITVRWDTPFPNEETFRIKTKWNRYADRREEQNQYVNTDIYGKKLFDILGVAIKELKEIGVHGHLFWSYSGHMPDYLVAQLRRRPLVQNFRMENEFLLWEEDLDLLCFDCDRSRCHSCGEISQRTVKIE